MPFCQKYLVTCCLYFRIIFARLLSEHQVLIKERHRKVIEGNRTKYIYFIDPKLGNHAVASSLIIQSKSTKQ